MEVILDELTPMEFFGHGGIVKVSITDEEFLKESGAKKKYTFFDYKAYSRFLSSLYAVFLNKPSYERYKYVNEHLDLKPSIGHSIYVIDLEYDNTISYESAKFYYYGDKREQEILPKDPYGIKNVCFSGAKEDDEDWDTFVKQRLSRGFDDSELWNLDATIAKFIYPRLKEFYESIKEYNSMESNITFEKMLKGFELLQLDRKKTPEEFKLEQDAVKLFGEHYFELYM